MSILLIVLGFFAFCTAPLLAIGAIAGFYLGGAVGCIIGLILGVLATAGLE